MSLRETAMCPHCGRRQNVSTDGDDMGRLMLHFDPMTLRQGNPFPCAGAGEWPVDGTYEQEAA